MSAQRDRGDPLDERRLEGLQRWVKAEKQKSVARELGVKNTRSVRRWLDGKPFEKWRLRFLDHCLEQRGLSASNSSTPTNLDAMAELLSHHEAGRKLHFESFNPLAAVRRLNQFVFHPLLLQLPAAEMLEKICVVMSIYRQSQFSTDQDFLTCARLCLERVASAHISWTPQVSAWLCAAAWELVGLTVQRGHADPGIQWLDRISRMLAAGDCHLLRELPESRQHSMQRMLHYGHIIAHPDIRHSRLYIDQHGSPIDTLAKIAVPVSSAFEIQNIVVQQMAEHLRFADAFESTRHLDAAVELFDVAQWPALKGLSNASSSARRADQVRARESPPITPSTAMAATFQAFTLAARLDRNDSASMMECGVQVARQIQQASGGSILLQSWNRETQRLIRRIGDRQPDTVKCFAFVNDVASISVQRLLAQAGELLDLVQDRFCSAKPGSARASIVRAGD